MDKALRYLGLAAKAGRLVIGAEDCAKQIAKGKLFVAASDAASNTLQQARTMAERRPCPLLHVAYTKLDIAQAIGRGNPVALALICDEGLAKAFAAAAEKE